MRKMLVFMKNSPSAAGKKTIEVIARQANKQRAKGSIIKQTKMITCKDISESGGNYFEWVFIFLLHSLARKWSTPSDAPSDAAWHFPMENSQFDCQARKGFSNFILSLNQDRDSPTYETDSKICKLKALKLRSRFVFGWHLARHSFIDPRATQLHCAAKIIVDWWIFHLNSSCLCALKAKWKSWKTKALF